MNGRWPTTKAIAAWALTVGLALAMLMTCPSMVSAEGGGGSGGGGGGGGGGEAGEAAGKPADPDYAAGVKAIEAKQYAAAIPLLQKAISRDGTNPDSHNWLAYAVRRNGDPAGSIPIYEKALALDPKHRGAHEYIGEAYLALDNLPKAKEHLARLDKLCVFSCSEYRDLKKAVQAYESSGGKVKPAASR
ncbi:MAG TPA: tetratricopeptide repeat protein [Methylomirabilota bacterium]|jgi:tetratricopeptide (TPR) repeat protein|nr:tetratricopeptide repeat protein [Methylomirabilota bacterium]